MTDALDISWLLVGTGDIVRKRVAAALCEAEGSAVRAVCGGRERAEQIAEEFGIGRVHDDLDEAMSHDDIDAVYIATPVYRHADEALKAILAGKHVLIEKPLGLSAANAQPMVDEAAQHGVTAGCAYYRRCFPRYHDLKQQLDADELGTPTLIRTTYHAWFDPDADDPKRWRLDPDMSGGGPLSDMGCHMLDVIVGLFGLPESVFAHAEALIHPDWGVEDSSAIVMRMPGGAHVLASFGWNSQTWVHEFEVVGSKARVRWFPADNGEVVITVGRDVTQADSPNAANVHQPLIEDFVQAIRENRAPICPLSEAIKTNQLLDAIYRSAETQRLVKMSRVEA